MKRNRNSASGIYSALFGTALGFGAVIAGNAGLIEVNLPFTGDDAVAAADRVALHYPSALSADAVAAEAAHLLSRYFSGERVVFDLPLDLGDATPFQIEVYRAVSAIPYGAVRCYGEVAEEIGHPGAARGVGSAMARNPLPIVIPCHRVVGSAGGLTGYSAAGGVASKKWLLDLEGVAFVGKKGELVGR